MGASICYYRSLWGSDGICFLHPGVVRLSNRQGSSNRQGLLTCCCRCLMVSKLDLIIPPGSYLVVIARGQLHCKDIMISLRSFMFYRMELKHEMKRSIKKWKTISNLKEKLDKDFLLCCILYWSIKQKLSIIKIILTYCLLLAVMAENQLNSPPTIQRMKVSLLQPLLLLSYHRLGLASYGQGPLKQQGSLFSLTVTL